MRWIPSLDLKQEGVGIGGGRDQEEEEETFPISGISIQKEKNSKYQIFKLYISYMNEKVSMFEIHNDFNNQFEISKMI